MPRNYIEQLKAIIETTGWTQVKLAQELQVTFATLNRWLNLRAKPHPSTQKLIGALYKKTVGLLPIAPEVIENGLLLIDKEKKQHRNILSLLQENKNLREDFLLELTYNSNAIEGSTLTKKETETIIFDKGHIEDKSLIEHLEATNHAAALEMILKGEFTPPVSEATIKELHRILMQGIRSDAGHYSKYQRAIRGVDLILPAPEDIEEEMQRFLRKINRPKNHLIEHVAKMHADFEAIHPFGDGNGRVGRFLMIIQLLAGGYPPCVIENNQKADYYDSLEFAQKKSESHLILFIINSIQKGYQIIKKHRK